MMKEYLGIEAVGDLFDIIGENYVSREDLENCCQYFKSG